MCAPSRARAAAPPPYGGKQINPAWEGKNNKVYPPPPSRMKGWKILLAVLAALVIFGVLLHQMRRKDMEESTRLLSYQNQPEILVILLSGTSGAVACCQQALAQADYPGRVTFAIVQEEHPDRQDIRELTTRWQRFDLQAHCRVVPPLPVGITQLRALREVVARAWRGEPHILCLAHPAELLRGWDVNIVDQPAASVHLVDGHANVFPCVSQYIQGVPHFTWRRAHAPDARRDIPLITVSLTACAMTSNDLIALIHHVPEHIIIPDWALPSLLAGVLLRHHGSLHLLTGVLKQSLNITTGSATPRVTWTPAEVLALLTTEWLRYARVTAPEALLGVTQGAQELEVRWKWGDTAEQELVVDHLRKHQAAPRPPP